MPSEPLLRLRQATQRREELRREWDQARNRDLVGLLLLTLPPLFSAERGSLFVLDPTNKKLWLEAGTGVAERRIVVDVDGSLVGEALREGAVIGRAGLESAPGQHQSVAAVTGFTVRNALTAPVFDVVTGQAVGAVQVLNKAGDQPWSEAEKTRLRDIAHVIGPTVSLMHAGQHLLTAARTLDEEIHGLDRMESAIRGGRMMRTFEPVQPLDEHGFLHHRFNGKLYPPFIDRTAIDALRESWDTDADDVFIATHQKVGTHLAKKFVVELVRQGFNLPPGNAYETGDIGHDTVPWPEVMYSQHGRAHWEHHVDRIRGYPRIWYVHCAYEDLPVRRIHPDTRFLVVFRDPRAVAVSQYFFWKKHPLLKVDPELDLDSFVERFVDGDLYFGDYHRHVTGWLQRPDQRIAPDRLLALRYEDLVERKEACALEIGRFLGQSRQLSAEQLRAVVDSTDFDTMRAELTENPQSFHLDPKVYFRAGKTRDWEQHLSPLAVEAIDQKTLQLWGRSLDTPPLDNVRTLL